MHEPNELKWIALDWIKSMPPDRQFRPSDVYRFLCNHSPGKIHIRADFEKDGRWGIDEARRLGYIEHMAHGIWKRIFAPEEKIQL